MAHYTMHRTQELGQMIAPFWLWDVGQVLQGGAVVIEPPYRKGDHIWALCLLDSLRKPVRLYGGWPYGRYKGEAPDLSHLGTRAYVGVIAQKVGVRTRRGDLTTPFHEVIEQVASQEVNSLMLYTMFRQSNKKN